VQKQKKSGLSFAACENQVWQVKQSEKTHLMHVWKVVNLPSLPRQRKTQNVHIIILEERQSHAMIASGPKLGTRRQDKIFTKKST
jgi:hypothetical protein